MLTQELMREVKRLEIRARRRVDDLFAGEYHSAFKGQGVEFAEVREYEPGDDVRSIDWNVTARTGRPFIKRFVEERQLTVALLVDRSASNRFGSGERTKARAIAEVGAVISMAAARNGDRVGMLAFSDRVETFVPPTRSRTQTLRIIRELLSAPSHGRGSAMPEAARALHAALPRHAIVFVLSDFDERPDTDDLADPGRPGWFTPLRTLASRHDVTLLRVTDPREDELPDVGLVETVDPETGRRSVLDTSRRSRARLREARAALDARIERSAADAGLRLVRLSTDGSAVRTLSSSLHERWARRSRVSRRPGR